MREQRRFEFILIAEQPIAHHAESFGNTAVIMRRKVRQPGGGWAQVPAITGDTMRHGLREAAAFAFLDAAGLLDIGQLSEPALRLLFSGGQVTGSAGGAVKLTDYREMVDLVPPLALLGGCSQNRIVPGHLWVDDAMLVCTEYDHMTPDWVTEHVGVLDTQRAHVEIAQRVRMDPMLDPGKRKLLSAGDSEAVAQRLLASENASELDDAKAKLDSKSTMLPRTFERIAQGSLFHWSVTATCHSELEVDTFAVMCATFLADARVGGKKGTGHGLLRPIVGRNIELARMSERATTIQPDALSTMRVGEVFRSHVAERAEKIASFLGQVVA